MFGKKALATCVLGSAAVLEAAPLYTNTWSNTEGVGVVKNWNDAANWTVAHGGETPAPASSVPTADSRVIVSKSSSITLQDGDDLHVGELRYLANVGYTTGNLTIPSGARLSLDGTGLTSFFGHDVSMAYPGGHNHITVDVNGGDLVLGQSRVWFKSAWNLDEALIWLKIRNGGTVSVTNGVVLLKGGSEASGGGGRGPSTNLIDIVDSGTLKIEKGSLSFSANDSEYSGGNSGGGCKIVNVRDGGKWLMGANAGSCFFRQTTASLGVYINVGSGGTVDFSGRQMLFLNDATNVITMTGGVLTNTVVAQQERDNNGRLHLDLYGGDFKPNSLTFGTGSGRLNGPMHISIHGTQPNVRPTRWNFIGTYTAYNVFMDFKLAANTPRDGLGVAPFITNARYYDSQCGQNRNLYGWYRLAPEGGMQLVHTNTFDLVMRPYDGTINFNLKDGEKETYRGVIGGDLWTTNIVCEDKTKILGLTNPHRFQFLLNEDAELALDANGACVLPEPKARGYITLPAVRARPLSRMKRASVFLKLEPQGGKTVQNVVDGIVASGLTNAVALAETDYNVRVDLPVDQLAADCLTDRVLFDFTDVPGVYEARHDLVTTNAVMTAVKWAPEIETVGTMLILR